MSVELPVQSPAEGISQPVVITLMGVLRMTVNGQMRNDFRSNKARAILAYLLLTHPRPVARTTLCELLWPDYMIASALTNLRQSLANLREQFAPFVLLHADRNYVQLILDPATVWCDVCTINELLATCQAHDHADLTRCSACQQRLQQAVALLHGTFLEHFPEIASAPFMRWLQEQRLRLATRLAEAQAALAVETTSLGNLPPPLTPLVGRASELANLALKLQHTLHRCISLVGPGGIGKTRLACALGAQVASYFLDGVWLVELGTLAPAPTTTPEQVQEHIATAIAVTLGLPLRGDIRPPEQVTSFLADKTALLILDSFEYVSAGVAWLPVLLAAARSVRLLITTRHHLPWQNQWVQEVEGLVVPPQDDLAALPIDQWIAHYASVQLFIERTESAQLPLSHTAPTLDAISQLCRFVEGSPWAIELAVSLLGQQSPAAVLMAIQTNYRALTTPLLDVPVRQRSAEAVFRTAWQLLTPAEAQTLACCAVFHGGFTGAAAESIAATKPAILEALRQKSLLRLRGPDRYAMHDLVRQFAAEQLAQTPEMQNAIFAQHAIYYMELLQSQEAALSNQVDVLPKLQNDLDNIRAAWRWSTDQSKLALLEKGAGSLQEFYRLSGIHAEALQLLEAALATVRQASALSPTTNGSEEIIEEASTQRLLARLLCYIAQFYRLYRRPKEVQKGEAYAKEALAIGQHLAAPALQALAYHELARLADARSDYRAMGLLAAQGCTQGRQANLPQITTECLSDLGIAESNCKQPLAGIPHFQEALVWLRQQPNRFLEVRIMANLGHFLFSGHQYGLAYPYLQRVRALQQPMQLLTLINYGDLLTALGLYPAAQQEYAQGLAVVQTRRTVYWASWLYASYGRLQHLCGDMAAAQTTCRLARQIAQEDSQRFVEQWALINLGHVLADLGELAEAGDCYQQAISAHQAGNWLFRLPDAQAGLATVLLAQNEATAALTHIEAALAHLAQQGLAAAGEPFGVYWSCARVLTAVGDPRAQTVLAAACQALQECAATLPDAEARHAFLQTVAANRNLLKAAQAAGLVQHGLNRPSVHSRTVRQ